MIAVLTTTFYYTTYPFVLLFSLLLTIAAPLVHLGHYVVYGLWWWPLCVLAKFEVMPFPLLSLLPSSLFSPLNPPPQQNIPTPIILERQNENKTDSLYFLWGRDPGRRTRGHEFAFRLPLLGHCLHS